MGKSCLAPGRRASGAGAGGGPPVLGRTEGHWCWGRLRATAARASNWGDACARETGAVRDAGCSVWGVSRLLPSGDLRRACHIYTKNF